MFGQGQQTQPWIDDWFVSLEYVQRFATADMAESLTASINGQSTSNNSSNDNNKSNSMNNKTESDDEVLSDFSEDEAADMDLE